MRNFVTSLHGMKSEGHLGSNLPASGKFLKLRQGDFGFQLLTKIVKTKFS